MKEVKQLHEMVKLNETTEFSPEIEVQKTLLATFDEAKKIVPHALTTWEQRIKEMTPSEEKTEIDQAAKSALEHVGEQLEEKRKTVMERIHKVVSRYPRLPFALGLATALSAHAPVLKDVEPFKTGIETTKKVIKNVSEGHLDWMQYDKVYSPQSEADKKRVEKNVQERKKREDPAGMVAYQKKVEREMEQGKQPRLKDMVFELERLAGTPPEKIDQAKKIAEAMAKRYAEKAKERGKIDEAFLGELTQETYGGETVYDWGQASVTEYFITKKRNCVSVDYAQEMIIEEAIEALPEQERKKYSFGSNEVKQHVRTVVTIPIGSISKSFLLDGRVIPIAQEKGNTPEKSATIDSQLLKKSLVSSKPIEVSASKQTSAAPKALDTLIDIKTDQPLKRNVIVQGELADAEFNERQLEKEQVQPVHLSAEAEERIKKWKDTAKPEDIFQVEILENDTQTKVEKALKDAREAVMISTLHLVFSEASVNLTDITFNTKEELKETTNKAIAQGLLRFDVGDTEKWSNEVVQELGYQVHISLDINPSKDGVFDQRLIEAWKKASADPKWEGNELTGTVLKINNGIQEMVNGALVITPFKNGSELFKHIPKHITIIDIRDTSAFSSKELESVVRPIELRINYDQYKNLDETKVNEFIARGGKLTFLLSEYINLLRSRPTIKNKPGIDIQTGFIGSEGIRSLYTSYQELLEQDSLKYTKIREDIISIFEKHMKQKKNFEVVKAFLEEFESKERNITLKSRMKEILQQK
ncbi:hypothetical protein IT408_02050 [Candidatus Uhrbacteria bacterium]|nr:hypothetical protein [Candidatus Uhrbacteria bacterium]